jgi:hypothetical protein
MDERWTSKMFPEEYWDGARFVCGSGRTIIVKKD